MQFGDDKKRPTAYAFAMVEHRLPDKLRLRMHLDGEIKRVDTNDVTTSKSLLNVRSRIREQNKSWHIMKVILFIFYTLLKYEVSFFSFLYISIAQYFLLLEHITQFF